MVKVELNDNDTKLISFCLNRHRTLTEISKQLSISIKNISVRIDKLKQAGLIKIENSADKRKVYVRSIQGDKTKKYFFELLKILEERGGSISHEEFLKQLPFNISNDEDNDKWQAPLKLMYMYPPLVELYVKITSQGKKFLEDNKT